MLKKASLTNLQDAQIAEEQTNKTKENSNFLKT
jgi:hypothetical protein